LNTFRVAALTVLLFILGGCATLGKTEIHQTNNGAKVEYLLLENNASTDTVIFENGLGGKMAYWVKVLPEVSKKATVFAYNRPSYGKSDDVATPRDSGHITAELRELLAEKGLKPPYILVGHSVGGLYMQHYARRYPDEVKALILVDSTHPKQFTDEGSMEKWSWFVGFLVNVGLNESQKEELRLISKSGEDILALPTFDKTVVVLSASKPMKESSKLADHANKLRKDIANLYPNSKQTWVDSGHVIPLEKPEAIVDAVYSVVAP
jgi:predicted alpha/beta hydrolase family esterase